MSARAAVRAAWWRVRATFGAGYDRARADAELREELQTHLAMQVEDGIRRGMAPEAARRRALVAAGSLTAAAEAVRAQRGLPWLEGLGRDVRSALRALAARPSFTVTVLLTLALGLGATTAIFTVVDGALLRPLPYPHPERIVRLFTVTPKGGRINFSDPDYDDVRQQSRSFAALAEVGDYGVETVLGPRAALRAHVALVSRDFFRVMGVAPVAGRAFAPEEQQVGGRPAVVVSHGFWRQALGSAPLRGEATVTLEGRAFNVVGVMPPALDYPRGADLWIPRELEAENPHRTGHNFQVLARLDARIPPAQAQRELRGLGARLSRLYAGDTDMRDIALVPLQEHLVGGLRPALLVLLAAAGFLLLIACANVANLVIARLLTRGGELALRLALGASRARLVQQFLVEAFVLALAGGTLGVLVAAAGVRTLLALAPATLPRLTDIHLRWPVLLFALGLSVATALAIGLLAAWRATRADLRSALAQNQRTQAGSSGASLRRGLVVAQVAATMVLLVGAGLLGRSFLRLMHVNPGFRTHDALVLELDVPGAGDADLPRTVSFYDALLERLHALPGVSAAGLTNALPLADGNRGDGDFIILSRPDEIRTIEDFERVGRDRSRVGHAEFRVASAGYFRAMQIPLMRGRLFDERDGPEAPHVAVISTSLAQKRWPGEDPIGKVIEFGNMDMDPRPLTIVGVVGDVRDGSLADAPYPTFYTSYRQRPRRATTAQIVLAGNVETPAVITAARAAVRELRPDVPPQVHTIESVVAGSVGDRRFTLLLVAVFGFAALVLATVGVYGVISYAVAQRRAELGVRMALGARPADVVRLLLGEGVRLSLAGVLAGVVGALALTRLLAGLLFGVGATDPVSFLGVALGLLGAAVLASVIPAWRATGIGPVEVMRS